MSDLVENLIADLLEWLDARPRTYGETMDAWRTHCPRFPIWEDATDRGLVETVPSAGDELVRLTPAGRALLAQRAPNHCSSGWSRGAGFAMDQHGGTGGGDGLDGARDVKGGAAT